MAGYIIYNGYWNADSLPNPVIHLLNAAEQRGINLIPFANTETAVEFDGKLSIPDFDVSDFALFWDKDVRLARAMETIGIRLYNSADTVAVCDDKAATHIKLAAEDIPMPKTIVAPMTYVHMDEKPSQYFLNRAATIMGFPMVVKECFGSLGGQVYLAHDMDELKLLTDKMAARPFICQQFIKANAGTDIRIYIVDGQPVAAMRRRSETDFRANVGNGGMAEKYVPSAEQKELAVRCCNILGALFAGVDILIGDEGEPLVCEVNSNAHMQAISACSGVDVAGAIIDSVLARERQR
ncbi:MAG: RimK family alpha-L-glutamate ligase [Oscillospiraceae bacterium]|nr:RimK family alpha-L-glutamate ligase [Oscillospiraceae bacterium]MDD3833509.1 RimK family alpha-L-glutamate ligase [Oscillospiraceae bacterium]MDD4546585.1 RimK family alpha-L-glutamate ligase [Oscillospiraceae bacterium]